MVLCYKPLHKYQKFLICTFIHKLTKKVHKQCAEIPNKNLKIEMRVIINEKIFKEG